jgi:hypothetical protein
MIHVELIKRLGAISSHEKKSLTMTSPCKLFMKRTDFSRKDERRASFETLYGLLKFVRIIVDRHLGGFFGFPGVRSPFTRSGGCFGWFCSDIQRGSESS